MFLKKLFILKFQPTTPSASWSYQITLVNETQTNGYKCIYLLFNLKEQLVITLQNMSEVNRERSRLAAAYSVCDLTKHNGLVTQYIYCSCYIPFRTATFGDAFVKYFKLTLDSTFVNDFFKGWPQSELYCLHRVLNPGPLVP